MKKKQSTGDKSETLRTITHAIFELEATKGHLAWKVTDLVRKCGFSRSLIYRYLGSSKAEMLESVLTSFLNEFYGLDSSKEGTSVVENIRAARSRLASHSEAIIFYQKWRTKASKRKVKLTEIEKRFQKKIKKANPQLTELEILTRHAVIHGLVTAPFLQPDEAAEIYKSLFEKE